MVACADWEDGYLPSSLEFLSEPLAYYGKAQTRPTKIF
jgi:hypothetical protein